MLTDVYVEYKNNPSLALNIESYEILFNNIVTKNILFLNKVFNGIYNFLRTVFTLIKDSFPNLNRYDQIELKKIIIYVIILSSVIKKIINDVYNYYTIEEYDEEYDEEL